MKLLKKWLLIKLCILLAMPFNGWAQALPVAQPDRVGRSISGVLQDGMRTRGFAANDPRFGNTLARISPQLSGVAGTTAAAVTVGAVTAPAWVSVAAAIVVGAVITYAVNLGIDSLVKWLFRADSKIDESSDSAASPSTTAMVQGGQYWLADFSGAGMAYSGDGQALALQANAYNRTKAGLTPEQSPTCSYNAGNLIWYCGSWGSAQQRTTGAPASCPAGSMYLTGVCTGFTYMTPPVPAASGVSIPTAVSHIPASDYDKPLNPVIVAGLANSAWQKAASQPGYDGLPYPQSNPITATEVATWTAQNPSYAPTVRDFVAPNPVTTANPQPWALPQNPTAATTSPAVTPNANTTNPAAANPQQNLGADPAIAVPTLEQTPTAQMILQPILNLLPDLKNFNPTMAAGTCPRPTLNLFGQTQTFEAHCTMLENNRAVIHAAMVLAFTLSALLIILSA